MTGKQHHYCPNCGAHSYDNNISVTSVKPLCCSAECRKEWELKYARAILKKDEPESLADGTQ